MDTGPDDCYPKLKKRLAALPVDAHGRRSLDVFVVTHIDHDHIGGARLLLDNRSLALDIGDVWFNAPSLRRQRGIEEGESLARLLGAQDDGCRGTAPSADDWRWRRPTRPSWNCHPRPTNRA